MAVFGWRQGMYMLNSSETFASTAGKFVSVESFQGKPHFRQNYPKFCVHQFLFHAVNCTLLSKLIPMHTHILMYHDILLFTQSTLNVGKYIHANSASWNKCIIALLHINDTRKKNQDYGSLAHWQNIQIAMVNVHLYMTSCSDNKGVSKCADGNGCRGCRWVGCGWLGLWWIGVG